MVGILITYKENVSDTSKKSYMEGTSYESVLTKFLIVKGGKKKITIESIQDWNREKNCFERDPITFQDKSEIVYKVMHGK